MDHLLYINDNANSFLPQPLDDDDDNILTIPEEDEVNDRYGFWKERPRDPLSYRVPKPPTLSGQTCHVPTPPPELGSGEGAGMDLRLSYARYLNTRVQGMMRPLTPLVDRWDALTAHPLAQGVVRHGHEIPFKSMGPPPFNGILNSSPSNPAELQVLRQELQDMVAKGAVERVPDYLAREGYYSHYFLVLKRDGGQRLTRLQRGTGNI